ncbi:AraC family transcriptional regulator [Reinekea marinisedimentorum]|uniref:AraC-like DNA-binding protein n=1 Tax=Reinekea marinisedimentorum TaxID=230495 RepID=A0A4R3IB70_9GAMM|nr:AraC family transcriptional regulator [Reinekea marinisedimentorum]TCS43701.1 AraC-like DNA-binding protein [Reinekea marinisedimentorum]
MNPNTVELRNSPAIPGIELRKALHSAACYGEHTHDEFSLGAIDSGSSVYKVGNQRYSAYAGTVVLISPNTLHSCNPDNDTWSYRMLYANAELIKNIQQEILATELSQALPFDKPYVNHPSCFQLFSNLFDSLIHKEDTLQAESYLLEFIQKTLPKNLTITPAEPDRQSLALVRRIILKSPELNHSLENLAAECGLSRYHLLRSFKDTYGQTPHAFQLDTRIKIAKEKLKQGHSLSEIANNLGFADQAHFQRQFKKLTAMTPKLYQKFLTDPSD